MATDPLIDWANVPTVPRVWPERTSSASTAFAIHIEVRMGRVNKRTARLRQWRAATPQQRWHISFRRRWARATATTPPVTDPLLADGLSYHRRCLARRRRSRR